MVKSLHLPKPNVQAGDINLRGRRKSKMLSCRCCEVTDLREKTLVKGDLKELIEEIRWYFDVDKED